MIQHLFDNSEFLQSVFDAVPSFLFIVDSDVRIHHLNAAALSLLGAERGRVLFRRGGELLYCIHASEAPGGCGHAPACRDCVIRNSVMKVFGGGRVHRETARMKLASVGRIEEKFFSVTAAPFRYLGELFALLVLEDVTAEKELEEALERRVAERTAQLAAANEELEAEIAERKKAEEALKESEEQYRSFFNHSLDGILLSSPEGRILAANPEACSILGRTEEEILEAGRSGILDMADPKVKLYLEERARSGKARGEVTCLRKNGEKIPCEHSAAVFRDKSGNTRVSVIFRDISEKKRLESIAEALNMMDNIGYVFSGIRHELGNPLNTTKFNLDILKRQYRTLPGEKIGDYIDRALEGVARIEFLLKSLKSFNLFEEVKSDCVSLRAFLDNFLAMAKADFLAKGIKIKSCLSPSAERAHMDERAFNHALLNVFSNAADALEGVPEPVITVKTSGLEDMILVTVEDNGPGMTGEQMRNLFKPFHTTKPKGTGLGLVIVKKMMSKMKGGIEVTCESGKGTVVSLFLPACTPPNGQRAL
ncbi:MAG: PAS domain S-box protein [Nitrospiraceae bacterium]|nr:PAS domain S-box protein [Nitrospiraceae bacterium]